MRKPKVLLLDEATRFVGLEVDDDHDTGWSELTESLIVFLSLFFASALDAESEHLVQSAIDDMIERGKTEHGAASMTVLIAAHRLSTVRNADKIFVIQDGQVVEEGNHVQLMEEKPDGAYAALIRRQLEAQEKLETGA